MARGSWIVESGTVYRGGTGQWSFLLHRVSGLALALWFTLLVVQHSLLALGADFYDRFRGVLDTAPYHRLEVWD